MGKAEIILENTAAEYLDRAAKTEENVGWIMETIDVIGKTTELNTEYIHELHEMVQEIIKRGHIPVNPANVVHEGWSYKQYIDHDLILLSICDAIYMLEGWEESRGASLELNYAMTTGMQVIFEEDIKRGWLL